MVISKKYQWAVIGSGPAGIAAVGKLLDNEIDPSTVLWIDPHFKVGDFGLHWSAVSSNTRVGLFIDFLNDAKSFHFSEKAEEFPLSNLPPDETCFLHYMAEPLQWVTNELKNQVASSYDQIKYIQLKQRCWTLTSDCAEYQAQNVILATGAVPTTLNYPGVDVIPFETAITTKSMTQVFDAEKTYGVFGSSHSAIIIIKNLIDLGAKRVINFYRSPCRYAVNMGNWILFDNTGLKGQTAAWARQYVDGQLPTGLERYMVNEHHIARYLPECSQVIYAVGFTGRKNIVIADYEQLEYDPHTGIIAPGLFGLGIAYPELKADPFGRVEAQVGLWKFMNYLNKVLPLWLHYPS